MTNALSDSLDKLRAHRSSPASLALCFRDVDAALISAERMGELSVAVSRCGARLASEATRGLKQAPSNVVESVAALVASMLSLAPTELAPKLAEFGAPRALASALTRADVLAAAMPPPATGGDWADEDDRSVPLWERPEASDGEVLSEEALLCTCEALLLAAERIPRSFGWIDAHVQPRHVATLVALLQDESDEVRRASCGLLTALVGRSAAASARLRAFGASVACALAVAMQQHARVRAVQRAGTSATLNLLRAEAMQMWPTRTRGGGGGGGPTTARLGAMLLPPTSSPGPSKGRRWSPTASALAGQGQQQQNAKSRRSKSRRRPATAAARARARGGRGRGSNSNSNVRDSDEFRKRLVADTSKIYAGAKPMRSVFHKRLALERNRSRSNKSRPKPRARTSHGARVSTQKAHAPKREMRAHFAPLSPAAEFKQPSLGIGASAAAQGEGGGLRPKSAASPRRISPLQPRFKEDAPAWGEFEAFPGGNRRESRPLGAAHGARRAGGGDGESIVTTQQAGLPPLLAPVAPIENSPMTPGSGSALETVNTSQLSSPIGQLDPFAYAQSLQAQIEETENTLTEMSEADGVEVYEDEVRETDAADVLAMDSPTMDSPFSPYSAISSPENFTPETLEPTPEPIPQQPKPMAQDLKSESVAAPPAAAIDITPPPPLSSTTPPKSASHSFASESFDESFEDDDDSARAFSLSAASSDASSSSFSALSIDPFDDGSSASTAGTSVTTNPTTDLFSPMFSPPIVEEEVEEEEEEEEEEKSEEAKAEAEAVRQSNEAGAEAEAEAEREEEALEESLRVDAAAKVEAEAEAKAKREEALRVDAAAKAEAAQEAARAKAKQAAAAAEAQAQAQAAQAEAEAEAEAARIAAAAEAKAAARIAAVAAEAESARVAAAAEAEAESARAAAEEAEAEAARVAAQEKTDRLAAIELQKALDEEERQRQLTAVAEAKAARIAATKAKSARIAAAEAESSRVAQEQEEMRQAIELSKALDEEEREISRARAAKEVSLSQTELTMETSSAAIPLFALDTSHVRTWLKQSNVLHWPDFDEAILAQLDGAALAEIDTDDALQQLFPQLKRMHRRKVLKILNAARRDGIPAYMLDPSAATPGTPGTPGTLGSETPGTLEAAERPGVRFELNLDVDDELRTRLTAFYTANDPTKLSNIEKILKKYGDHPELLNAALVKKYGKSLL